MARKSRRTQRLRVVNPDCAGIDIGKDRHFVAVDPERTEEPVRSFGAFTRDLEEMAAWLASCGVTKVAMESTSVYWIPVYETLERAGFEVMLVPPRMTKQIGGRKSDVLDCQWIWQLMSYGLLRGAFRRRVGKAGNDRLRPDLAEVDHRPGDPRRGPVGAPIDHRRQPVLRRQQAPLLGVVGLDPGADDRPVEIAALLEEPVQVDHLVGAMEVADADVKDARTQRRPLVAGAGDAAGQPVEIGERELHRLDQSIHSHRPRRWM